VPDGFGGCVDRDEDQICSVDGGVNLSTKKEITFSGSLDNFEEGGLMDREGVRFPCCYARLAEVDNRDFDVGIFARNYRACWAALG
jgi:hypothetical protein